MTAREMIEKLSKAPPDAEVMHRDTVHGFTDAHVQVGEHGVTIDGS